jgi:hypothetical protein
MTIMMTEHTEMMKMCMQAQEKCTDSIFTMKFPIKEKTSLWLCSAC